MPSPQEAFTRALKGVVSAARNLEDVTVETIAIDLQASGEHPYRLVVTEEQYPVAGVVTTDPTLPE